ncbi:lytic murein transglycosylase [Rhizobium sp. L1K21]|uniref:lytic murein transglycosylase n=1 Tax=Rhizobium sp. L1K21 TaxID=2954933 RepID=UPI002092A250|nr:lytic murein transglycosylase [Rhizobium sp. L1K21]MCO6184782.1 lytic murein transglycosylase [Rhizobium sp. L1K21]
MRWKEKLVISLLALLVSVPAFAVDRAAVEKQFHAWLENTIWPQVEKQQVPRAVFDAAFKGVTLNWKLPDLVPPGSAPPKERKQSQAEFSSPGPYFNEKRLNDLAAIGRRHYNANKALLDRIESAYGVPGRIIIAIWGRETGYGTAAIPYDAMEVLATKAFMSTRKDMFEGELIAGLHILAGGDTTPGNMKSSWAGALGQPQFMPSSFLRYAVDFDGDRKRDIWNSKADTFASIANYLAQKGWQRGRDWGYEVTIPNNVSCAQEGPDLAEPIKNWAAQGINRISGKPFPSHELSASGMMLVPAGRFGPEFIVTPNFYVIKEYNNSDLYALFIGNLADRIAYGSGAFQASWGNVGHMLRSDVLKMQQVLVAQGHDVGKVDGLPGYKTRRSIGRWQAKNGIQPTCFPTEKLLQQIR